MPRSNSSSAMEGVMPKPPAAFSALAMTRSTRRTSRSSGRCWRSMVRPGRPKMSPMKRIRTQRASRRIRQTSMVSRGLRAKSLRREFGGGQEVVVAGRVEAQVAHPPRVNQHVVQVPEIDVGQVVGQEALQLSVNLLALFWIQFAAALVDEFVGARVGIVATIGAIGRGLAGLEGVLEDIGIVVAPDPAQGIKLEGALGHVGEEGGELVAAGIERDPHPTE